MNNLVIGSITSNLNWDQCKLWVNSLNQSGYKGDKLIVIFGDNQELEQKFQQNNFEVVSLRYLEQHEHVCVVRFFVYYAILKDRLDKYNFVLATDVMDVIFQKDPFEFLNRSGHYIIASSENIKYKDEMWGANNVRTAFGDDGYDRVEDRSIYNAGVMAGPIKYMVDLYFLASKMCEGLPQQVPGGGGSDQAAYNLLLSTKPFIDITNFIGHDSGWACQVGTVADPYKDYSKVNIDPNPTFVDGTAKTSTGVDYFIVHQYNRNPVWKRAIEEKYK